MLDGRLRRAADGTGGGLGSGYVASDGPIGTRSGTLRNPLTTQSATLHASGVYLAGGRSYYAGGRVYGYHHGLNAYMPGIAVSVRDASTKELDTNYDRFELTSESYIDVPDAGGNWPLTLTVHNATLFSPGTATRGGEAVFVAMYTTSGDECAAAAASAPEPRGPCPQPHRARATAATRLNSSQPECSPTLGRDLLRDLPSRQIREDLRGAALVGLRGAHRARRGLPRLALCLSLLRFRA